MDKGQRKKEQRLRRQAEQRTKSRNMRILVWTVAVCFVALIAVLIMFKPKAGTVDIAYDKLPTLGKADAPVKIVEVGDFKCPTCARFSQQIMPEIKKDYIDTGKVSLSYQNWTIISPESDSLTAALAGQAVYHQSNEAFWQFYDIVLKNQEDERSHWATADHLIELAKQHGLKLDYEKLKQDIEKGTYKNEVDRQNQFAVDHRFTGTPTVLVNGRKLDDKTALNYNNLKAEIETALQEAQR